MLLNNMNFNTAKKFLNFFQAFLGLGLVSRLFGLAFSSGENENGQCACSRTFNNKVQLYPEKCTGRYFKFRDDDLSSKQGSLCTFKIILIKITQKYS